MPDKNAPAAQFLRMSTEHQQYSFDNQSAAIKRYAQENGFEIMKTM
jgi:DNA invertase Pin-like site-specific DNA recombinase